MVTISKVVILLVDDDPEIVPIVRQGLAPFNVVTAGTVAEARTKLREMPVDLILLDVSLPDVDGFSFCQELVSDQSFKRIPIVMVSGRGEVSDIVFGLNSGADDYIAKPINIVELKARIDACLRRAGKSNPMSICFDGIELNPEQHVCVLQESQGSKIVTLTPTEFRLMFILLNEHGKSLTREELTRRLWSEHDAVIDSRSIDSHISRIRKKLGPIGDRLVCTHGRGYAFLESKSDQN